MQHARELFQSLPHPLIHHAVVPILQLKSYDTLEICELCKNSPPFRTMDRDLGATPTQAVFWGWGRKCLLESCPSYPAPNCPDEAVLTEVWPNGLSVLESASLNCAEPECCNYWSLRVPTYLCKKATAMRRPHTAIKSSPCLPQLEKGASHSNEASAEPTIKK